MTLQLFDIPEQEKVKPENRCRNCIHLVRNYYNANMKYCSKQKSNRTSSGFKKIGSNDPACPMFERKSK